jgi:hypothetical protein
MNSAIAPLKVVDFCGFVVWLQGAFAWTMRAFFSSIRLAIQAARVNQRGYNLYIQHARSSACVQETSMATARIHLMRTSRFIRLLL